MTQKKKEKIQIKIGRLFDEFVYLNLLLYAQTTYLGEYDPKVKTTKDKIKKKKAEIEALKKKIGIV